MSTPKRTRQTKTPARRTAHDQAARDRDMRARAVNAEVAGMYLDGLASLLSAWPYYLRECDPGPTAHERVGMFTTWALNEITNTFLMPPAARRPTLNEITMAAEEAAARAGRVA